MNEPEQLVIGPEHRPVKMNVYHAQSPRSIVIVAPAMGVLQNFYRDISLFLANQGFTVLTFDYVGMVTASGQLRVESNSIAMFGTYDLDNVIRYARIHFPELPLFFVGHSIGGQIFPLAEHAREVSAAFLVASQQVSRHLWTGFHKVKVNFFWSVLLPAAVRIYGHLPGFVYGGKYNLQKAIARDWSRLAKTKDGISGDTNHAQTNYQALRTKATFVSLHRDNLLAPRRAVLGLMYQYGSTHKTHKHLRLNERSRQPHFDFFRKSSQDHWPMIAQFFRELEGRRDERLQGVNLT